ncbi:MAG TPA: hypothetical protein VN689_05640, partial [Burkholderiales bacterium]|nr:hypothetical protein [Burkholderiales bacterium]
MLCGDDGRCHLDGVPFVHACDDFHIDCDNDPENGCEAALETSLTNCGMCGNECSFGHAKTSCNAGVCQMGICDPGYADCDADPSNGCEANLNSDPRRCGTCSTVCPRDQGPPVCKNGACGVSDCSPGLGDCDNQSGCETTLGTVDNCYFCGDACNLPHATSACVGDTCRLAACTAPYDSCDGKEDNGCETNLLTNPVHCGSCEKSCSMVHGTAACAAGACQIACSPSFGNCDKNADTGCETDLSNTLAHCGACDHLC